MGPRWIATHISLSTDSTGYFVKDLASFACRPARAQVACPPKGTESANGEWLVFAAANLPS